MFMSYVTRFQKSLSFKEAFVLSPIVSKTCVCPPLFEQCSWRVDLAEEKLWMGKFHGNFCILWKFLKFLKPMYRVTHLLADWVGLTWIWDVPQAVGLYCSCGAAQARQWNIPNPSQPNPVREEMGHPVRRWNWREGREMSRRPQNRITSHSLPAYDFSLPTTQSSSPTMVTIGESIMTLCGCMSASPQHAEDMLPNRPFWQLNLANPSKSPSTNCCCDDSPKIAILLERQSSGRELNDERCGVRNTNGGLLILPMPTV